MVHQLTLQFANKPVRNVNSAISPDKARNDLSGALLLAFYWNYASIDLFMAAWWMLEQPQNKPKIGNGGSSKVRIELAKKMFVQSDSRKLIR